MTRISAASSILARRLRRRSPVEWTAIAIAVFGAFATYAAYREYVMEDAYITYRYAQNLAAGRGFVFNPGESLLGTSTPLYTLVLAAAGWVGLDIVRTSAALFSASLAATALLGASLLRRFGHPALSILFAVLAIWGACDVDFFFGMEIPFYLMLLFAAFRCALGERRTATGILLGLTFLTRYDAALFALSLCAVLWWRDRRVPWRTGLVALGVVLPWLLFAQLYFGSVFPNTLAAKARELDVPDYMYESVARQIAVFFSPLHHFWPSYLMPKIVVAALTLLLVGPIFAAARKLFHRERLLVETLLFPALLWLGYSWIAPPLDHFWYLIPATYFLLFLSLLSWGEVTRRERPAPARPPSRSPASRALRWTPVAALVVVTLLFLPGKLAAHARIWMESSFYRARTDVYFTLARWIEDVGLDDVPVLMHEPGYFAYHSGSPMIDAAGLVTEGIYYHGPVDRRTPPDEIVRKHRPGLIVTPPLYWIGLTLDDYLPLYHPVPARFLYVRRAVFAERFDELARHWLSRDAYHPNRPDLLRHPVSWNFERGVESGWITGGAVGDVVGQPRPARYERKPVEEDYLHTSGPRNLWATLSSPPFTIDFDELSFRFGGTHRRYTRARLLVDGQLVLQQEGDGRRVLNLHDVYWPVWSWKGKVGVLQLDDADIEDGWLGADHVRSIRYRHFETIDDFEAGVGEAAGERAAGMGFTVTQTIAADAAGYVPAEDAAAKLGAAVAPSSNEDSTVSAPDHGAAIGGGPAGAGGYGAFWETGFGAGPSPLEPLALEHGLPMLVGRHAALSRGVAGADGPVEMRSRPFRIEREGLSFVMFDFGGAGVRVELRVGGEVRRSWSGQGTRRLQGIVWGVRGLMGQEAVLAVVDEVPGDAEWIGIDDVAKFDRPAGVD